MSLESMFAILLCIISAARLVFFGWHVRKDTEWLDRVFGPMPGNDVIAREWSMTFAAVCACAALLLVAA